MQRNTSFKTSLIFLPLMKIPIIKSYSSFYLGLIYIALSLCVGEQHPFSLVGMYSQFSDEVYSFYLTDNSGALLPLNQYFDCKNDFPSHLYESVCDAKGVATGHRRESISELALVGKSMLSTLRKHQKQTTQNDVLIIHRNVFFIDSSTIKSVDTKMYETDGK
jgi:hypothetical protein